MAKVGTKPHDYHLVEPSAWPVIGAFGAFSLALGAVLYFISRKAGDPQLWYLVPGTLIVLVTMIGWWRDVIREAEHEGHHTAVVQLHLRYGMILFIISEVMFFVAWFWAYFDVALFPADAAQVARTELTGGHWPPVATGDGRFEHVFDPWDLPFLNTLILLASGTTVTWAHHSLIENDRNGLIWGLILTVVLGILFTICQVFEYSHAGFQFAGHIYGSTFYMATGFHGFHVIVGTIFLSVILFRAISGHFTPTHHFGFEAAAWYWHFVDVVWLFLFVSIYLWGSGNAIPF
jgi:cytochrome c oxidase subunit 3